MSAPIRSIRRARYRTCPRCASVGSPSARSGRSCSFWSGAVLAFAIASGRTPGCQLVRACRSRDDRGPDHRVSGADGPFGLRLRRGRRQRPTSPRDHLAHHRAARDGGDAGREGDIIARLDHQTSTPSSPRRSHLGAGLGRPHSTAEPVPSGPGSEIHARTRPWRPRPRPRARVDYVKALNGLHGPPGAVRRRRRGEAGARRRGGLAVRVAGPGILERGRHRHPGGFFDPVRRGGRQRVEPGPIVSETAGGRSSWRLTPTGSTGDSSARSSPPPTARRGR